MPIQLLFLLVAALVSADNVMKSLVIELTRENWNSVVLDPDRHVLVEFYAPWCGHCKKLIPEWESVASTFRHERSIAVAKIDSIAYPEYAKMFGVSAYPVIKLFTQTEKREPIDFHSSGLPRDAKGFVQWINEHCGTERAVGGRLSPLAGRKEDLDKFATRYMEDEDAESILKDVTASGIEGGYYAKVLQKVIDKGDGFVREEIIRLTKMISSDTVTYKKADELQLKLNVLVLFDRTKSKKKN
eukprot:TRINITY_DN5590_c0_g1_i1.p2 TRINITY_DN5590_c0_g1~~TRINITY_DN5590_c0_g1_i1.p2  ORF type:complete len:243 (-),score=38.35 TRINITY_DN5590_c0_g1_i1:1169-1897(-)